MVLPRVLLGRDVRAVRRRRDESDLGGRALCLRPRRKDRTRRRRRGARGGRGHDRRRVPGTLRHSIAFASDMAVLLQRDGAMELIAVAALVVLSIALGLTASRIMLWAVLFFMTPKTD